MPLKVKDVVLRDVERSLRLLICTWNVGNRSAKPEELKHWLPEAGKDLDLVVVGAQGAHLHRNNHFQTAPQLSSPSSPPPACHVAGTQENSESEVSLEISRADLRESSDMEVTTLKEKPISGKNEVGHAWDEMLAARLGSDWGVCKKVVLREMRLIIFARNAFLNVPNASRSKGYYLYCLSLYPPIDTHSPTYYPHVHPLIHIHSSTPTPH
jgi:hypothetical protein